MLYIDFAFLLLSQRFYNRVVAVTEMPYLMPYVMLDQSDDSTLVNWPIRGLQ